MSDQRMKYLLWAGLGLGAIVEYPNFKNFSKLLLRDAFQTLGKKAVGKEYARLLKAQTTIPMIFNKTVENNPDKVNYFHSFKIMSSLTFYE